MTAFNASTPVRTRWSVWLICPLRVENEREGDFELWADFSSVLSTHESEVIVQTTGRESLAQPIVDKIEVAPVSNLTHDCDFVIFQESPRLRELCQHQGQ